MDTAGVLLAFRWAVPLTGKYFGKTWELSFEDKGADINRPSLALQSVMNNCSDFISRPPCDGRQSYGCEEFGDCFSGSHGSSGWFGLVGLVSPAGDVSMFVQCSLTSKEKVAHHESFLFFPVNTGIFRREF